MWLLPTLGRWWRRRRLGPRHRKGGRWSHRLADRRGAEEMSKETPGLSGDQEVGTDDRDVAADLAASSPDWGAGRGFGGHGGEGSGGGEASARSAGRAGLGVLGRDQGPPKTARVLRSQRGKGEGMKGGREKE